MCIISFRIITGFVKTLFHRHSAESRDPFVVDMLRFVSGQEEKILTRKSLHILSQLPVLRSP
jgi:hypothetical protein